LPLKRTCGYKVVNKKIRRRDGFYSQHICSR
jgi:hypothetical protein